ncbi:hypothetical protein JKP88DRAFT_250118 [Tribonema minus]|uniref:Uncharacterized protein n=1 Tax=Tribonema minus TaxID=303371 RepID=A0A835YKD3_9STRA|nr:hypothetical protein JKP88DRAFT_250118 [Tribonema minus]
MAGAWCRDGESLTSLRDVDWKSGAAFAGVPNKPVISKFNRAGVVAQARTALLSSESSAESEADAWGDALLTLEAMAELVALPSVHAERRRAAAAAAAALAHRAVLRPRFLCRLCAMFAALCQQRRCRHASPAAAAVAVRSRAQLERCFAHQVLLASASFAARCFLVKIERLHGIMLSRALAAAAAAVTLSRRQFRRCFPRARCLLRRAEAAQRRRRLARCRWRCVAARALFAAAAARWTLECKLAAAAAALGRRALLGRCLRRLSAAVRALSEARAALLRRCFESLRRAAAHGAQYASSDCTAPPSPAPSAAASAPTAPWGAAPAAAAAAPAAVAVAAPSGFGTQAWGGGYNSSTAAATAAAAEGCGSAPTATSGWGNDGVYCSARDTSSSNSGGGDSGAAYGTYASGYSNTSAFAGSWGTGGGCANASVDGAAEAWNQRRAPSNLNGLSRAKHTLSVAPAAAATLNQCSAAEDPWISSRHTSPPPPPPATAPETSAYAPWEVPSTAAAAADGDGSSSSGAGASGAAAAADIELGPRGTAAAASAGWTPSWLDEDSGDATFAAAAGDDVDAANDAAARIAAEVRAEAESDRLYEAEAQQEAVLDQDEANLDGRYKDEVKKAGGQRCPECAEPGSGAVQRATLPLLPYWLHEDSADAKFLRWRQATTTTQPTTPPPTSLRRFAQRAIDRLYEAEAQQEFQLDQDEIGVDNRLISSWSSTDSCRSSASYSQAALNFRADLGGDASGAVCCVVVACCPRKCCVVPVPAHNKGLRL